MADRRWTGNAQAVTQVTTIAVTGTWATSDTAALTINGKDLIVTIGSDAAIADVVAAIVAAINASTATADLVNDESRNVGGQQIAEFTEVTANGAASPITLTANTAGKPFVVSVSETTAGSGALGSPSDTTAATGPNFADNADNWSGATVPVDGDDVIIDSGDVSVLYGLDQNAVTPTSLTITQGYTGTIGLPVTNADNSSNSYREYRDTALKYGNSGDAGNIAVAIGEGEGSGSGRIKLDFGSGQYTANIYNSGQAVETGVPSILLLGTHASNELNVLRGNVAVAFFEGETSTLATLRSAYIENQAGDVSLHLGDGVTLTDVEASGGTLVIQSATTTLEVDGAEVSVLAGAHAAITVDSGSLYYRSTGTLTNCYVSSGALASFARDPRPRTVTNAELSSRGTILDPLRTVTWTNGIDLYRCRLSEVTLDLGAHLTLTPSAI